MALRILRKGNSSLNNDHNTMINREKVSQHPISAIEMLNETLDSKYEFPVGGIPITDLGFVGVEMEDVISISNKIDNEVFILNSEIAELQNQTTVINEFIINYSGLDDGFVTIPNRFDTLEIKLFEEYIAEDNDTMFNLVTNYIPNNNSLEVFVNGRLLRQDDDYIETNEYTVTFLKELRSGDYIVFKANGIAKINSPIHEEHTYIDNPVFELEYSYNIGDNSLSIYHNGLRLNVGSEYTEVDNYTVSVLKVLNVNDVLIFRRETHMVANLILDDGNPTIQETWKETIIIDLDETDLLTFEKTYTEGSNTLQVFENGILLNAGETGDYIEHTQNSILLNYPAEIDDKFDIVCVAGLFSWYETFIVVLQQSIFNLKNKYNPNLDELLVYEDGMLLFSGTDYYETNNFNVTFSEPIETGSKIVIYKRR